MIAPVPVNCFSITFFEYSAACLSVIFELLPRLIKFASLGACWVISDTNVDMNINYSHPATMYEIILAQMNVFLDRKISFTMFTFISW